MRTFRYSGNGSNKSFLPDVKGLIILNRKQSLVVSAAKAIAAWQALINPATVAEIVGTYIDVARGFEPKTKAPEFTESNTGFKEKTKDFAPEFTAYGFMSYADYIAWFAADCGEFSFIPVLANGNLIYAVDTLGKLVGFEGRLFTQFDLPKAGGAEKQKAHPFDIMFDDVEQIKNYKILETDFERRDLQESVPVGLHVEVMTPYESTGGTVVLKVTQRGTDIPFAGLTLAPQWEVVSISGDSGGAITAISATNAVMGVYTLTVLNGAAKMTNDFELQGSKIETSHVTYLTNVLNIVV
jgi:hypothetical protein